VTAMPSGGHQGVAGRLFVELAIWCRAHARWRRLSPGGVYITQTTWLEPDIAIYPSPEFDDMPWQDMPPPLLVVEVLSKSTAKLDRHRKRAAYLAHGLREVWLVNYEVCTIKRWTSASEFPEVFRGGITWTLDAALPSCVVTDAEVFGPVKE
ncbi:MAG: Uma2 family endonuclease, partial [Gemmatimonadaceae bacterium]